MDSKQVFVVSRSGFLEHHERLAALKARNPSSTVPGVTADSHRNVLQQDEPILQARLWQALWTDDFTFQGVFQRGLLASGGTFYVERCFTGLFALLIADSAACLAGLQQPGTQRHGKQPPEALARLWCRVAFAQMNLERCDIAGMLSNALRGRGVFEQADRPTRERVRAVLVRIFSEQSLTLDSLAQLLSLSRADQRQAA